MVIVLVCTIMKRFLSKKKHPRVEKIFDVFFDPTQEALELKRVRTDQEITDRSIWRKIYNRHRLLVPVGAIVVAVLVLTLAFHGRADVAPFYATNCLGSWQGSFNATGEPETDSGKAFTKSNAARVTGSGELFCGGFIGTIPEGVEADQAFIKLAISQHLGLTREKDTTETAMTADTEIVEGGGLDLATVAYTLDGTTWVQAGVVRQDDIFNGTVVLPIDEVYWSDVSSIQVRVTALESAGTLYLDAVWVEIAHASSLDDELAGLDPDELEGVRTIGDDELDILKSDKRIFRANEEVEFEFEIPSELPPASTTTPEESPPEEQATTTEEVNVPPDSTNGEDDETATTSPQAWLGKAREFLSARLRLTTARAQEPATTTATSSATSTPAHVPIPRVVGFKLLDASGKVFDVEPTIIHAGNKLKVTLPEQIEGLRPGQHTMQITIMQGDTVFVSHQDFFWGVLAVNLNKSIFKTGEEAYIQMAALNEGGFTICDAGLELTITDPQGSSNTYRTRNNSITSSDTCGADNVTDSPDYFVYHVLHHAGEYVVTLTNKDTGHSVDDTLEVHDVLPYSIERVGATRINPFKAAYEMQLLVETTEDFDGEIIEQVPASFDITSHTGDRIREEGGVKLIVWDKDIKAGEKHILQYTYQAPKISPELFLLGPSRMESSGFVGDLFSSENSGLLFEEARRWQLASDAVEDFYIARAPGTNLITNNSLATEQTLTYDTEVQTSADITRQSGNQAFRIQNSGRYLIIANTRWNYADLGNNNRHVVRTLIKVGGSELGSIYGEASGYGRDGGSADEDGVVVVAYVDHTVSGGSADDITVHVQNFGDTSVALADQFANESGIQIIRLPDDDAYLQVSRTTDINITGTLGFGTGDPTWNEFGWQTQDAESDSSVIEWVSGNDITLKEAGHYLVIYSIASDQVAGGDRTGNINRLKLDDVEIPASRVVSYQRDTDTTEESWVQWAGIIESDAASEVLNIDWGNACESNCVQWIDEAAMTVVRMPDTASYVRVRHDANRAGETTGVYPLDAEDEDDENTHSTVSNTGRISGTADGYDWLLFASWFARTAAIDSTRVSEHFRWSRTGTIQQYGSGLSYHRGDQGSDGVPAGGRNAAFIADNLGSSEYIALDLRHESGTGDQNRDFIANRVGVTGVALDTLVSSANSDPAITSASLNSGSDIILNEGTFKYASTTITVSDADGCDDVTSVTAKVYRGPTNTSGTLCTADDTDCYVEFNSCVATTTGDTCGSSPDTTGEFDCGFKLWYIADPTDSGAFASDIWSVAATATDASAATVTATNTSETVEVATLLAHSVTATIAYGSVDPGTDTGATNQSVTVTNTGNAALDSEVSGDIMCTDWSICSGGVLQPAQQKFGLTDVMYASLSNTLAATPTPATIETILVKPTSTTTPVSDSLYWGIAVPNGQIAGSYEGQNVFTAIAD